MGKVSQLRRRAGRTRKSLALRHPSCARPPTLIQRALAALRRKLDDQTCAGPAGLLEFCEDITKAERTAGERFARDCLAFRRLAAAPMSRPAVSSLEHLGDGRRDDLDLDRLDPDQRAALVAREQALTNSYNDACDVMRRLSDGKRIMREIENVFISEIEPEVQQIPLLREGLKALVRFYDCARRVQLDDARDPTCRGSLRRKDAIGIPALSASGHIRRLEEVEADMIRLAFGRYRGQMTEIAKRLGMGRTTLYRRMRKMGLK